MYLLFGLFIAALSVKLYNTMHHNLLIKYIVTPCVITSLLALSLVYRLPTTTFAILITLGLGFSILSDSLMMIEGKNLFMYAMGLFSIVQILYIVAFMKQVPTQPTVSIWMLSLIVLVISIVVYELVVPHVPALTMKIGLGVYLLLESVMVIAAIWQTYSSISALAMIGAIMFWISDMIIGWNLFKDELKYAEPMIWALYGTGQFLIAYSMMCR